MSYPVHDYTSLVAALAFIGVLLGMWGMHTAYPRLVDEMPLEGRSFAGMTRATLINIASYAAVLIVGVAGGGIAGWTLGYAISDLISLFHDGPHLPRPGWLADLLR